MADAIVLINTEANKVARVAQAIVEIHGVRDVYSVAGEVDLVAVVSVPDFDDLTEVIPSGIARVDGVVSTQTLMAFRQYSSKDQAVAFNLGMDRAPRRSFHRSPSPQPSAYRVVRRAVSSDVCSTARRAVRRHVSVVRWVGPAG